MRQGWPKIMPPTERAPEYDDEGVDPHVLRAIAKAWSWRRKLDSGQVATIDDLADAQGVSHRYVGRMMKLAWLAPVVLNKLLIERIPPTVSVKEMIAAMDLTWAEQEVAIFEDGRNG